MEQAYGFTPAQTEQSTLKNNTWNLTGHTHFMYPDMPKRETEIQGKILRLSLPMHKNGLI